MIVELPNKYILRRWSKSAKASRVMDDLGGAVKEISETSLLGRRRRLLQLACNLIDEAVVTEDDTKLLEQALLSTQKPISLGSQHNYKEPLPVRLKGGKEKALKKPRSSKDVMLNDDDDDAIDSNISNCVWDK